jgi:hypothetical protein
MIHSGLVTYHADLAGLLMPIDDVHPHPANYNNGDVEALSESIEVNGMYRPIYVQKTTGNIIAGNHTWVACKGLGAEEIPVVMLDVDNTTALRIMLADNRVAALAVPDNALLLELLDHLADADSLMGTGYKEYDHEVIRKLTEMDNTYDEFATWPTICVQVPPHVRKAYFTMTEAAVGDRERFELLLRLAGWDGSAQGHR